MDSAGVVETLEAHHPVSVGRPLGSTDVTLCLERSWKAKMSSSELKSRVRTLASLKTRLPLLNREKSLKFDDGSVP